MALDGAKFICLSKAAAADAAETTPAAVMGDVPGDRFEAAAAQSTVIKAKGRIFTVGYYMSCDYVLEDPRAIGVHCEIQCDAFGRVTIHNMSKEHPIRVNGQVITIKRPLLDGSRIQILDGTFLWKFPKSVDTIATSNTKQVQDNANDEDEISSPHKLVAEPPQAPNSCPDLKPHRKVDKRFTVHNFAYCINSDDEGNTSSELPSITESEYDEEAAIDAASKNSEASEKIYGQLTEIDSSASGMLPQNNASQDRGEGKVTVEILKTERRSVTPEAQPSAPTNASTPLIKLEDIQKLNLINCTQNKANKSTEKNRRLITLCQQSDLAITSFSPRETGVRNEKSFTAVFKPALTGTATTPKSVYSTPKSMISDYNDEGSRDFIDFTTPATSKKILGGRALARNSSMHLIDLTTPNKLTPSRSRPHITLKCNKTLPSNVKLSANSLAFAKVNEDSQGEEGLAVLPVTPLVEVSSSKPDTTPQSAESVISVDGSTGSYTAVIEVSTDDSATSSTSSAAVRTGASPNTPKKAAGQKQLTSTPLRSTQSLKKRAILNSAKKKVNTPLRKPLSSATLPQQATATPARNVNLEESSAAGSSHSTPKSRLIIGSPGGVSAVQRRGVSSSIDRSDRAITTSTPVHARAPQSKKVVATSSRFNVEKSSSPLHRVRKSFGGTALPSHISKSRRSIVSPRRHSPTYIGAKIVTKARNFTNANTSRTGSRSHSLVAAAINSTTEKKGNTVALLNTPEKEGKDEVSSEDNKDEVDDLSRTFTMDALEEINVKVEDPSEDISKTQNVTFSPIKQDSTKRIDESTSHKKELNITFSPEKSLAAGDGDARMHISESFAEVVESKEKPEEVNKAQETVIAILEPRGENVVEESIKTTAKIPDQKADTSPNPPQCSETKYAAKYDIDVQQGKIVANVRVIETLDADEISNSGLVAQSDNNTAETAEPLGESQGTADFLEEIEYVLNKSDELQQQLGKNTTTKHTNSGVNENTVELEAENLGGNTKGLLATENTNASDNTGGEENLKVEQETNFSKVETEAEDTTVSEPNDTTARGIYPEPATSNKVAYSANSDIVDDMPPIDNVVSTLASEITSTGLNAGSMESEIVSIISMTTPSEFDVSIIGSTSVEKSIITLDEQEAGANRPVTVTEKIEMGIKTTQSYEVTSTGLQTPAVSVNEPESTTDEATPLLTEDHENEAASQEIIEKTAKLKADVSTSQAIPVKSEQAKTVESEYAKASTEFESLCVEEVKQETFVIDEKSQPKLPECQAKSSTVDGPISNEFEKVSPSKRSLTTETKSLLRGAIEDVKSSVLKPVVSKAEHVEPMASIPSAAIESKELLEVTIPPKETETLPNCTNGATVGSDENRQTTDTLSGDEEKENKIITYDEDNASTSIGADSKATALEPKPLILCGLRDMLRTPKHSEAITPRFVGLRNLMRTPKASTSAAAAARAAEEGDEELIGLQALLKTPIHRKQDVQTPQPTTESKTLTPRRRAIRRASANAELTPTRCVTPTLEVVSEMGTPRRTARRRASASTEGSYTPQRITRRRSSLSVDNVEEIAAALTPQKRVGMRAKRTALLTDCSVVEDMGAIIEEEPKEAAQKPTDVQQCTVETVSNADVVESKEAASSTADVIEDSICEEVSTQKQQAEELKEEIMEEKENKKSEDKAKLISEIEPAQLVEESDKNGNNFETAAQFPTDTSSMQFKKWENDVDVAGDSLKVITTTDVTEEHLQETEDLAMVKTEETAEILDESDYEYGKEVKEAEDPDVQLKTPKTHRKSVRTVDAINDSPKTPVMVGMRELLKTPKRGADTPKLIGVRDLVGTPKSTIASAAMEIIDDEERFKGLADLVKTPKFATVTKQKHSEDIVVGEEEPSTLTTVNAAYIGMRELLKTPKHTSTPQYRGMRELLRTPKACSSPQLGGLEELMQTPKRTKLNTQFDDDDDGNVELDQFFKTPRAKDVMIPAEPASAVLEAESHSTLDIMTATTEYELHSSSQRGLEDIYKTPVSTRLSHVGTIADYVKESSKKEDDEYDEKGASSTPAQSDVELIVPETPAAASASNTTPKRNLSAEEAFDELVGERTTLDDTPPQKVYARKRRSVAATTSILSPFSATEVISDLPKTDIQEWVDSLEEDAESEVEEREVTVSASILEASKATRDPIAESMCETSGISVSKDTTEELLADISAVSSMVDPLLPSAAKSAKFELTAVVDEIERLRPITPLELDISGINSLDQTNESVFSEPLVVSDSESVQDKQEIDDLEKEKLVVKSTESCNETASGDANKSMGEEEFPTMFVDSSDSESEEIINATKTGTPVSSAKQALSATLADTTASDNIIKNTPDNEVIDLDDSSESITSTPLSQSEAEKTSKTTDLRTEFINFQAHKNLASQQMRSSTPNRCSKALKPEYTRGRRQSMGAEKLLVSTSIDLANEKSRLAKKKASTATHDENCIIEVDEEFIDESAAVEKVTSAAEEDAATTNDARNKDMPTLAITEEFHTEFNNFQAHKTIASHGKRAATPDQVKKPLAQKLIQSRRLTLGAAQYLSDVTIDFVKEKSKPEQSKQPPAHIDECILEIDDSVNESDSISAAEVTTKGTEDDVTATESGVQVGNSPAEPKEETLKSAQVADTAELIIDEPTENAVQNMETEKCSTTAVDNVDDVKIIEEATDCSTTETEPIEPNSDEPESTTFEETAAEGPATEEGMLSEIEKTVDIRPIESRTLEEIAAEEPATEEVILLENENKPEIPPTVEASIYSCEAQELSDDIPAVQVADPQKTSTTGNEFIESDIFDLTDEFPKEASPVINTTKGVIFDLTEEEDIEESIGIQTNERIPESVNLSTARTEEIRGESSAEAAVELRKIRVKDVEIVAGEIETVAATELKIMKAHLDTSAEERSAAAVASSNEMNLQISSAPESGVGSPVTELDIDNEGVDLPSTAAEGGIATEKKASGDNEGIKEVLTDEVAETKIIGKQEVAEIEQHEKRNSANEVVTDALSSDNEAITLAVSMESLSDAEIPESDAVTPKTEIKTTEIYTSNVEVPKLFSDIVNEVNEANVGESAQVVATTDVDIANACASVNMQEEKGESVSVQAETVVRLEDSVIELNSDVKETTEVPLADTNNEQQTAIESDTQAIAKKVEKEKQEDIESEHVKKKMPKMASTSTGAPKALELEHSKPETSENPADELELEVIKDNAQLPAAIVPKPHKPEENTEDVSGKTVAADEVPVENAKEIDESGEAASSDRKHQAARRSGRKASRSKQVTAEDGESIFKEAIESGIFVEEPAAIAEQLPSDITIKHVTKQEAEVSVAPEEPTKTAADAKTQEEISEKLTGQATEETIAEECVEKLKEAVDASSSNAKQQPGQRSARKPSRSKKIPTDDKGESNLKSLSESAILTENPEKVEQKSQLVSMEAHTSEPNLESPVPDTTNEDTTEIPDLQTPVVEENADVESVEKEQSVKRRGRKASCSKQTLEGNGKDISETTISSERLAEEPLPVQEKPDLDKTEDSSENKESTILLVELSQKQVELIDEVMLPTAFIENIAKVSAQTVPKAAENVEEIVKLREETSSYGSQQAAKRKGRKPSQSKQTTEGEKELITNVTIENQTIIMKSALIDSEATISKAKVGNKTPADESAPAEEPTAEKIEELQVHIKASYEVCLSTTTDAKLTDANEPTLLTTKETEPADNIADKQKDAPAQRSTRRNRKGSQSSQCSNQDEDLLPTTTTTRRRGGRRRAETPVVHSAADEATASDVPVVKRRRGQGKATEDLHLDDIKEVQVRESKTEGQVIKSAETEDGKEVETNKSVTNEVSDGNGMEEKQLEEARTSENSAFRGHENIEVVSSNASCTESVSVKVVEDALVTQNTVTSDTATKRGASIRRRGEKVVEEVSVSLEKAPILKTVGENIIEEHSDAEELVENTAALAVKVAEVAAEKQRDMAVPKRGRRKQTVSESSQTSSTAEHLEPHTTQRRRRGRRPTAEEPIVDALHEAAKTSATNSLLAEEARSKKEEGPNVEEVLPTITESAESVVSSIADEHMKKGGEAIKTEKENEKEKHHAVAETSKRALTRNKRQLKSSEISKDNAEFSDGKEDLNDEPQRQTALVEQEEPAKKAVTTGRSRVNRRKKVEADGGEHQNKQEEDEHHKIDVTAGLEYEAKTETAELTVEQPSNMANESVGGRRGRRGAAAAATVAINEVSSAHKRVAPRGRGHQSKTQQQEDTKLEPDEAATGLVEEQKKAHKIVRKRRGSTAERQLGHAVADAEKIETEETESSTTTAAKRACKQRDSLHAVEFQSSNEQEFHKKAATTTEPTESTSAASTTQRGRRKRNNSAHSADGAAVSTGRDEPSKKRSLSRIRRDSSLDSSIHESGGAEVDANAGGNTSSSSTTPHRSRNVPRRAAAAQDRNYDESSDAEAQVDLKRRIEKASLPKTGTSSSAATMATSSKLLSPAAGVSTVGAMPAAVTEFGTKIASTPIILSANTTSRGGRQRKPIARVQQYLEEERAKSETPKKRLLLSSAAGGETPASQARATPARRTRKASIIETEETKTSHTPTRGRARNAKTFTVADTSEESRSEVEHTHSEIETTHSSSHAGEKESATTAKATKRPTRRGKQTAANLIPESELNEAQHTPTAPTQEAHSGSSHGGRAAKAAAAAALIPDEPTGSHTKTRVGRALRSTKVKTTEVEQTKESKAEVGTPSIVDEKPTKNSRTAAAGGRALRGGRRNKQPFDEEDTHSHTSQHGVLEDSEASSNSGQQQHQPQQSVAVDADDEHEEEEEALMITEEEEENKPLATVKGEKAAAAGKKRTAASTRRVAAAASAADSTAPKRGRRRAAAASSDKSDVTHSDTHSESAGSSRSRKVVRFDAATPSSTASAAMSVESVAEEIPAATTAPAKRATRSRRK